jgi:hypothetical protein
MRTDATLRREQSCRASEIVSEHSYPPDDTAINKTQNNHTRRGKKINALSPFDAPPSEIKQKAFPAAKFRI